MTHNVSDKVEVMLKYYNCQSRLSQRLHNRNDVDACLDRLQAVTFDISDFFQLCRSHCEG